MSLQFVMGPSGSGKSHYLYEKVTEESLKHPEKNYIVIVISRCLKGNGN